MEISSRAGQCLITLAFAAFSFVLFPHTKQYGMLALRGAHSFQMDVGPDSEGKSLLSNKGEEEGFYQESTREIVHIIRHNPVCQFCSLTGTTTVYPLRIFAMTSDKILFTSISK